MPVRDDLGRLNVDFRSLFDTSPTAFLVVAPPDWTIVAVNDARLAVTGGSREEQVGQRLFDLFPDDPSDPEASGVRNLTASFQRVIATGQADKMAVQRYDLRDADGQFTERWWSPLNTPVLDDQGSVTLIIHRVEEITELVRLRGEAGISQQLAYDQQAVIARLSASEAALQESEARFRNMAERLEHEVSERTAERNRVWEMSRELLAIIGFDGQLRAINPAWTATLGYDAATLIDLRSRDQVHPDDLPGVRAMFDSLVNGETVERFESRLRHADGSWRWISWTLVPEGDAFYAVGRNVTAEREAAEELEQAQEALRQSQKMEAMGSLTGGVAHDFNNLLTPIVGSLDLLQRKGVGGEREQRLIAGAIQAADRARTLVQRLLAFARRQPLKPVAVDVGELVRSMADLLASTTGPQVRVVVDVADDLPPAKADPNQLEMALLNLGVNARDAMPDGGTLRISATRQSVRASTSNLKVGHYVRLSVADTGEGMDDETLARAIEPFFSTKGIGKGTGLGLSMAHGLAAQLGGALTIQSRPGLGTNVELWLLLSAVSVDLQEPTGIAADLGQKSGLVLLVDDEDVVRASAADMLEELGYHVQQAISGEAAIDLVAKGMVPDLLVTDHLMPGMTGVDLIGALRETLPDLPALIVSGYAEVEGIAPGIPRLTKPFRGAELAEALAGLVPR
ncbi:PAS domain S-box protein [Sphingomonas aerophila]|uniref:histidine kinase n=1 Tax=Sphingomonas aerophila TaxID=1344948 RepID=A0A7W9EXM9_9SPHN|nr:PAS domain S-box protein [Sphingomonas aerophila]MBB5716992.1 PAS domain S-box-containing protein [Sphingomonas aerophila]